VSLVPPLPAALAGAFLLLVPGLVALALLRREEREALAWDETLWLAVALSVAASSWLGLLLGELGCFHLVTAGGLLAAASLAAALLGRRRLGLPLVPPGRARALVPAFAVLALALLLQTRPSEYLVGGRDPGAYVAAMALIGRSGGIVYTDPVVLEIPRADVELFFRHPDGPPFSWSRFLGFDLETPADGRVYPQFFHLFPAFGAYLFQAMGLRGALATPDVFGVLGTLGVFLVVRRLWGEAVGLLAALLLSLNVMQVWFSRYPVSEPMSQFLLFLGLLAFLVWEERGSAAFGAVAGAAFGLTLLVRIDSVLILLPLVGWLVVRRAERTLTWRQAAALLIPFVLLAGHAALHALVFARKYVQSIASRPYWQRPVWVWALGAALVLAVLVLADRAGPRLAAAVARRRRALRHAAVAAVLLLALYAYWLRPLLSAWAGGDGNPAGSAWPEPGLLASLGFARLAAHDAQALVRFAWFVTPLGLALGLGGLVLTLLRGGRRELLPLLVVAAFAGFYFYKIRVWADYPFAMRRYLPVVLPFTLAFAARALVWLASRGGARRLLAAGLGAALGLSFALATRPLVGYRDWQGAVDFVRDLARRFGPRDVLVFEQPRSIHLVSLPLWAGWGTSVLELARFNPDPDRLAHLVDSWRGRYANIYFVHTYATDLCGVFLQRVEEHSFGTHEWFTFNAPPGAPVFRSLRFTVSRVVPPQELQVPPLERVDIGGSDDFQVSGFFDKEGYEQETFRWTGPCASVYVPGARPGGTLTIRATAERRPAAAKPADVSVSLSGRELGRFRAGPEWGEHTLALPDPLPPGPPVLRLDVPAWRPVNLVPGATDVRDLGIVVDWIAVGPALEAARIPAPPRGGGPSTP
jgi:hypothetical protein